MLIFCEVELQWKESEKILKNSALISNRNTIQNLVNKVRVTGTLIERKPEQKDQLLEKKNWTKPEIGLNIRLGNFLNAL
jgi:hypothetical protein